MLSIHRFGKNPSFSDFFQSDFKGDRKMNFQSALPVVMHTLCLFSEYHSIIDSYLFRILIFFGVTDPMRLFVSVILRQIIGISYQYHYRQFYPEIRSYFSSYCSLYGADKLMETVGRITNSMASWKLALIQAGMIKNRCPQVLFPNGKMIADIDVTTLRSSSSEKEGSESGYDKKQRQTLFPAFGNLYREVFRRCETFPGLFQSERFFSEGCQKNSVPRIRHGYCPR